VREKVKDFLGVLVVLFSCISKSTELFDALSFKMFIDGSLKFTPVFLIISVFLQATIFPFQSQLFQNLTEVLFGLEFGLGGIDH